MYIGNEPLQVRGHDISLTMNDFWRWAGSDLSDASTRSVFAEFLVASSLDILHGGRQIRNYNLLLLQKDGSGIRIHVSSAAYVQADDAEHPDRIAFNIAPWQDAEVYVFCLYKAMSAEQSPLNTDLWEFYALRAKAWESVWHGVGTATLPAIISLGPVWCDYYGIGSAIKTAMTAP